MCRRCRCLPRRIWCACPRARPSPSWKAGACGNCACRCPMTARMPPCHASLAAMAEDMQRRYVTNEHWYRTAERWWHPVADTEGPIRHDSSRTMSERGGAHPAQAVAAGHPDTPASVASARPSTGCCSLWLFSIGLEWLGMVFWWPDEGLRHSREMLEAEVGYLQADFRRSLVQQMIRHTSPRRWRTEAYRRAVRSGPGLVDVLGWLGTGPPAGRGERSSGTTPLSCINR